MATPFSQTVTAQQLEHLYHEQALSAVEIARRFNVSHSAVLYAMRKHGIARVHNGPSRRVDVDMDHVRKLYKQGLTITQIAKRFGISDTTLQCKMRRAGIETRNSWESGKRATVRPWHDADWLRHQYHVLRRSQAEIAEAAGCTTLTIVRAMARHNITTRQGAQGRLRTDVSAVEPSPCRPHLCPHYEFCLDWDPEVPCPRET